MVNSQKVIFTNKKQLEVVKRSLKSYPPIVTGDEIKKLRTQLISAQNGKSFIIQGGPCAETFQDFNTQKIMNNMYTLIESSVVFGYNTKKKVVQIGRLAGQYAKPRSKIYDDKGEMNYRGDIINDMNNRTPDPDRMIIAYFHSCSTNNFCSSIMQENYYDLDTLKKWNDDTNKKYTNTIEDIQKGVHFAGGKVNNNQFFNSHECMLLDYEENFKRVDRKSGKLYLTSTHFPWIGERTRSSRGEHVNFLRDIHNPIGIKVGPGATSHELKEIIECLNPDNEDGKIVFIVRMGKNINNALPSLCRDLKDEKIIWISDPMHANTITVENKKTRIYKDIILEFKSFVHVCKKHGIHPSGIHLEMSGEYITECIDSDVNIEEYVQFLTTKYETKCDPRLNVSQVLNLAFDISDIINTEYI